MSYNPNVRDDYNALGLAQNVGLGEAPSDGQFSDMINYSAKNHLASVFADWFYPQRKEERQMSQQLIMDRLEPEARMEGLKAAGINPLTAAAGVAGSPSSSPTPASSVNPVGDVAGAVGSVAGSANDTLSAIAQGVLLGDQKDNLKSQTTANLEKAGLDHWNAMSVAELLPGLKANQRADYYLKLGQLDVVKQEYQNMLAEHKNIVAQYDEILSRTAVNYSLADKQIAEKAKIEEEKRWQQMVDDFFAKHGYDPNAPLDVSLRNCVVTGKGDPSQIGKSIEDYSYNSQKGTSIAERSFGTSKSPWEMGDKYMKRFLDWIRGNGEDDPAVMNEQIRNIAAELSAKNPSWDRDRIVKELYDMGFTNDEVYNAFK